MWEPIPTSTILLVLVCTWLVYTVLFVLMEAAIDLLVDGARWAWAIAKAAWHEEPIERPFVIDPDWSSSMNDPLKRPLVSRTPW